MRFRLTTVIMWILLFVVLASFCGCHKPPAKRPENYPQALILPPSATEVKYYQLGGTFQMTCKVRTDYPAADLIALISNELKQLNWQALKEDYLNPGLSSSHVRGWSSFVGGTKEPNQIVDQWLSDWENQAGEIVRYGLRYQYESVDRKDRRHLTVTAIFVPAPLVKQMREQALEFREKYNTEKTK
jgi:hypothetical protein